MINYTYVIVSVSAEDRCMEIKFSAEGRRDVTVGARLPLASENLEDVVKEYAPTRVWLEDETQFALPQVGVSGQGEAMTGETSQVEIPTMQIVPTEL